MAVKYTNNAKSTLASGINSSVTSATVADGSIFPALGAGEYFYITFDDGSNNEIAKVTARSGNTLTIVRAQDNTTARAFSTGDSAELRIIAAVLTEIQENIAAKSANQTVYSATAASNATAYNIGVDPGVEANASVFLDGVYQHHDTFSFSGSTLTFDAAPTNGTKIEVVVDNLINLQSSNLTVDTFTATSGQTAFTLSDAPGGEANVLAFIDGVFQNQAAFTLNSNTLTFDTGVVVGRSVTVYTINPVNIGTPSDSTVTSAKLTGNITLPGSLTVGAYDVAFDSPTFFVDHTNSRVGLGTSSPSVPVDIVGETKMSSHLNLPDNAKIRVGTGEDLQFYHDGGNSFIKSTTGWLNMPVGGNGVSIANSDFSEQLAIFRLNGAAELYYDGSKKLETVTGGVTVTGTLTATTLTGTLSTAAQPNITSVGTLTGFTSTGIDDNATSTAITIDSSENVMVGKASDSFSVAGIALRGSVADFIRDGNTAINVNRLTSDGELIKFHKGGTLVGNIGANGGSLVIGGGDVGIGFYQVSDAIVPINGGTGALRDSAIDLGLSSGGKFKNLYLSGAANLTNSSHAVMTLQAGTNSSASLRLKNDAQDFDLNVQTNDNFALYNHTTNKQPITVSPTGYMTLQHEGSDFGLQIRTNGATRAGLVIDKPNTSSIMGSVLLLSDESYRLGTASHYHMVMYQNGGTYLYGDDSAIILGVDSTGMFSNKNRYRFTDTTGGEHEVRTGGRNGTGTYTLFTNGSSNTQSAGTVEVWGIYGTPSGASYNKFVISGNRSIATIVNDVQTNSVPDATVSWNGSALQVANSNDSLYYHVRVELHDIGNGWNPTWGNFPGIS